MRYLKDFQFFLIWEQSKIAKSIHYGVTLICNGTYKNSLGKKSKEIMIFWLLENMNDLLQTDVI